MENRTKILFLILLLFLSCREEYFLVKNNIQLEKIKEIINDLDWKITNIDTFWNIDGKNILKYRIMYKSHNIKRNERDSLIIRIKKAFNIEDY